MKSIWRRSEEERTGLSRWLGLKFSNENGNSLFFSALFAFRCTSSSPIISPQLLFLLPPNFLSFQVSPLLPPQSQGLIISHWHGCSGLLNGLPVSQPSRGCPVGLPKMKLGYSLVIAQTFTWCLLHVTSGPSACLKHYNKNPQSCS